MIYRNALRAGELTPERRARAAGDALGRREFIDWCTAILSRHLSFDEVMANEPDPRWLAGNAWTNWRDPLTWPERELDYWTRVWAARSLLHVWEPSAERAVRDGLEDKHWRVREMCAKVAARHEAGSCADACARLASDDVNARVRAAAVRALGSVGEAEHAHAIDAALHDADDAVAVAGEKAAVRMESRLDRRFSDLVS